MLLLLLLLLLLIAQLLLLDMLDLWLVGWRLVLLELLWLLRHVVVEMRGGLVVGPSGRGKRHRVRTVCISNGLLGLLGLEPGVGAVLDNMHLGRVKLSRLRSSSKH